jgi:hypothetical protein
MTDFEVNTYQVMPDLAESDFVALKAAISKRGVLALVISDCCGVWSQGALTSGSEKEYRPAHGGTRGGTLRSES